MSAGADFIVIGAGSAGCVLANRLSQDPANRVLLIEAGGSDWSPMIHVPIGGGELVRKGAFGWSYSTEPQDDLGGRRMFWPRGKVIGGSSSINGQVYVRGHRSDFDSWAALGNRGWSYRDVLPYFLRAEQHGDRQDGFHGRSGPLKVSRGSMSNPLFDAFLAAGQEAGYPATDDFNGAEQEGFGRYDFNISGGRRQSSAVAYLKPARGRANLKIITNTEVERLEFSEGRAVAAHIRRHGTVQRIEARREIVLSAGTIGSPAILLRSGVGPAQALREVGVDPVHDLPSVGANLQDHLQLYLLYGCSQPITMHKLIRLDRAAFLMARAIILRNGPFGQFPVQAGAFTRTEADAEVPDTQWHFGIALGARRVRVPWRGIHNDPLDREGFAIAPCQLRPRSRGHIALTRRQGQFSLALQPNYLSDPYDRLFFRKVFQVARQLVAQHAFDRYRDGELAPGTTVQSDDEIDQWVRQSAGTCHHQVGTCRMGVDARAVVDDSLRVCGIAGLRVADASIMPTIIGGNTHAATVMIGEKAADLLLGVTSPSLEYPL